jgi:hypothetical protein
MKEKTHNIISECVWLSTFVAELIRKEFNYAVSIGV